MNSDRTEWLLCVTSVGLYSREIQKIIRSAEENVHPTCTILYIRLEITFFFKKKNSIKLLNIHYYGCRENVSLTSGFAPRAGYVFYSVALCYKTYKLPLVPEVVPHPSRAAPSSEVWDNRTPSYLYLTWTYSLLRKGSCIVMTDGQWYHQCCVSLS